MNKELIIQIVRKYPIAAVGLVVAILLGGVLYLRSGTLPEEQSKYEELEKTVEVIRRNKISAVNLEQNLEEIRGLVADMESRLMREGARTDHLRYFLRLAEDSQVEMSDPLNTGRVAPGAKAPLKIYPQLEWRITVRGNLASVLDFIHKSRTDFHPASLQSLTLFPVQGSRSDAVAAELNLSVLARP